MMTNKNDNDFIDNVFVWDVSVANGTFSCGKQWISSQKKDSLNSLIFWKLQMC